MCKEGPNLGEAMVKGKMQGKEAHVRCIHCEKTFTFPSQLRNHVHRLHSKSHRCDECAEAFDDQHSLRHHKSRQHKKTVKCSWPSCPYQNRLVSQVRRHEAQAHAGERAVACSISGCQLVLPYRQLARHVREEHAFATLQTGGAEKAEYECPTCGVRKPSRAILRKHIGALHSINENNVPLQERDSQRQQRRCGEEGCEKMFRTAGQLEDHLNKHRGLLPYECGRCAKQFSSRAAYALHLRKYHAMSIKKVKNSLFALDQVQGGKRGTDDIMEYETQPYAT